MGKLVLVRHGKTQYNQEGRFTGVVDISISKEGEKNAQTIANKLKNLNLVFDIAFTSHLKRAWETLDIILQELNQNNLETIKHPFLNERHYGNLQGRLHKDVALEVGEAQVHLWRRGYTNRPPNGESLQDIVHKVKYFLENIIKPHLASGKNVLICAHGNSIRAMVKLLEDIPDNDIIKKEIVFDKPLIYDF